MAQSYRADSESGSSGVPSQPSILDPLKPKTNPYAPGVSSPIGGYDDAVAAGGLTTTQLGTGPSAGPSVPKPGSNPPGPKLSGGTPGTTSSSLPTGLTQQSSGTYTVKKGDTLSKIARDLGVDVNTIATDNNISNPNLIKIGQVLMVRGAAVPAPSTSTDTQTTPSAVPVAAPAPTPEKIPDTPGNAAVAANAPSTQPTETKGVPDIAQASGVGGTNGVSSHSTSAVVSAGSPGTSDSTSESSGAVNNHEKGRSDSERNPNAATPATPATPADPSAGTPAVPATPATPATPANQTAENHRDTVASATPMPGTTVTPATPATPADPSAGTPAVPATPATPATGVGAETNSDGGTYTVVAGDTLFDIARRNGTDYQTLAKINNIANPRLILPGQNIKLPSAGSASVIVGGEDASGAGAAQYTVAAGDTLSQIAEKHGTDYQTLAKINGIKNPDLIHPGQNIKLPDRPMSGGAGLGNETSSAAQPINLSGFSDKP